MDCYVMTKSAATGGRWHSKQIRTRNHDQETRFIRFVKTNHDANATNQGYKSNFVSQSKDTEVNFGPSN